MSSATRHFATYFNVNMGAWNESVVVADGKLCLVSVQRLAIQIAEETVELQ